MFCFWLERHSLRTIERHCRTVNKGSDSGVGETWCDSLNTVLKILFSHCLGEWYTCFLPDVGRSRVTYFGMSADVMEQRFEMCECGWACPFVLWLCITGRRWPWEQLSFQPQIQRYMEQTYNLQPEAKPPSWGSLISWITVDLQVPEHENRCCYHWVWEWFVQ